MRCGDIPQSRDEILETFFVGGKGGGAQTPSPTSTMKASVKFCDFGGLLLSKLVFD